MNKSLDRIKDAAKVVCSRDAWHPVSIDIGVHALGIVIYAKSKALKLSNIIPWVELEETKVNPLLVMISYMDKTLGADE